MKKYLFLDIDGVLNSQDWFKSDEFQEILNIKDRGNKSAFDPTAIELLTNIVITTDCEIVISSSWRKGRTVEQLQQIFTEVGFEHSHKIIGTTDYSYNWLKPAIHCPSIRGLEIRVWLELCVKMVNPDHQDEYNYCILDDDDDMLYQQRFNFVNTDPQTGLTIEDVDIAIRILNNENKKVN